MVQDCAAVRGKARLSLCCPQWMPDHPACGANMASNPTGPAPSSPSQVVWLISPAAEQVALVQLAHSKKYLCWAKSELGKEEVVAITKTPHYLTTSSKKAMESNTSFTSFLTVKPCLSEDCRLIWATHNSSYSSEFCLSLLQFPFLLFLLPFSVTQQQQSPFDRMAVCSSSEVAFVFPAVLCVDTCQVFKQRLFKFPLCMTGLESQMLSSLLIYTFHTPQNVWKLERVVWLSSWV